jgi:rhodanese-related sulfurtransferase
MAVSAKQLMDEARQTVPEVSASEVHERMQRGELAILVDVREPDEWAKGHVQGAVHIPRGLMEWKADPTTPNHDPALVENADRPVVVMCASGGRSLLAAKVLRDMGYQDVSSLAGGFTDWSSAGLPVATN